MTTFEYVRFAHRRLRLTELLHKIVPCGPIGQQPNPSELFYLVGSEVVRGAMPTDAFRAKTP